MALVYYRGSVILAHFEIIPILAYINLTDPWPAHLTGGSTLWPPLPSPKNLASNSLDRNDRTLMVHKFFI